MRGGWCGEKNGGVNLHFSKLISPEYPSGKERGSFLVYSHQSILGRGTGEFSHQSIFSGENGGYFYFDLLFNESKIFSLGDHLVLRRRDLGNLILSHQSIFWEEKGGIFSPEYSSEVNGGIFWDPLTRVSLRGGTGDYTLLSYIIFIFLLSLVSSDQTLQNFRP